MKTILSMLLACLAVASVASAADLAVITGSERGTYHQFGRDLQKLVRPSGINLTVLPSRGSVDNVFVVSQRRNVHLGIVQSDVLTFVAGEPDPVALARVARSVRLVLPLYSEEVHVVGRREITEFGQLAGRRVAIGQEGSGAYLTARLLFRLAEVQPAEIRPLPPREALGQLKAGQIDAMIHVAGHPVGLLRTDVTDGDGLALIPTTNKSILESYDAAEIPARTYDWQPTAVRTVAVKAMLVTSDIRGPACESVGRVAQQIATGLDWLTRNGHPKWRHVDLDYELKGWEQSDCVRRHVGKPGSPSGSISRRE